MRILICCYKIWTDSLIDLDLIYHLFQIQFQLPIFFYYIIFLILILPEVKIADEKIFSR